MHPYKIAGLVLGALAVLFGGFMVVGFILSGRWEATRTAEIEASREVVFALIDSSREWEAWTPSPETGIEHFGPERGPGSGHRWDDPEYGRGEFRIVEADAPSDLRYEVLVEGDAIRIEGHLELDAVPGGTRVSWREVGDFGRNPLLGYVARRMGELQGAQLESSLSELARLVESEAGSEAPPPAEGATSRPD